MLGLDSNWGTIDILVNAAGINIANRTMADMDPADWDQVLAINATGAYNCMYCVLPEMRARRDGLIINISSVAGKRALTLGGVAYCASKFAMTALGTVAGNEVAAEGVRITSIHPGEVNTPILDNRPTPVSDERKAAMVQPGDFAELVVAIACLHPRSPRFGNRAQTHGSGVLLELGERELCGLFSSPICRLPFVTFAVDARAARLPLQLVHEKHQIGVDGGVGTRSTLQEPTAEQTRITEHEVRIAGQVEVKDDINFVAHVPS